MEDSNCGRFIATSVSLVRYLQECREEELLDSEWVEAACEQGVFTIASSSRGTYVSEYKDFKTEVTGKGLLTLLNVLQLVGEQPIVLFVEGSWITMGNLIVGI